jgi:hypothetical protein
MFRPYVPIPNDTPNFREAKVRAEANRPENLNLHRIVVPAHPADRVVFAALLRHELEHVRQFDVLGGGVFDLQDFLENDVLAEVAGGLDGCGGGLINAVPTEIDCNAAASVYVAQRFHPAEIQQLRQGPRRYLVCSLIPPAPHETLPARMVAFAFVYRAAVEAHAQRRSFPIASILGAVHSDARAMWAKLDQL